MQFPLKQQPSLLKAKPARATPKKTAKPPTAQRTPRPQRRGPAPALVEEIDGREYLVLRLPVNSKDPPISRTGKSMVVSSTRGRRRVYKIEDGRLVPYCIDGAHVCFISTAYVVLNERQVLDDATAL